SLCHIKLNYEDLEQGMQEQLSFKAKKSKQRKESYKAVLIQNEKGEIVIEKRPQSGLLANLWQFPMIPEEIKTNEEAEQWLYKEYGLDVMIHKKCGEVKHVFSHIIWKIDVFYADTQQSAIDMKDERVRIISLEEINDYPLPVHPQKMMPFLESRQSITFSRYYIKTY